MRIKNTSINVLTGLLSLGVTTILAFFVAKFMVYNFGVEINRHK